MYTPRIGTVGSDGVQIIRFHFITLLRVAWQTSWPSCPATRVFQHPRSRCISLLSAPLSVIWVGGPTFSGDPFLRNLVRNSDLAEAKSSHRVQAAMPRGHNAMGPQCHRAIMPQGRNATGPQCHRSYMLHQSYCSGSQCFLIYI